MDITIIGIWATFISSLSGFVAVVCAVRQLRRTSLTAQGQFLLDLKKMSRRYNNVHIKLRPDGDWSGTDTGPNTKEQWAELDDYMGFFEHCELLIRNRSLKQADFEAIFRYRIQNILANKNIVQAKLYDEASYWKLFLSLTDRLGLDRDSMSSR